MPELRAKRSGGWALGVCAVVLLMTSPVIPVSGWGSSLWGTATVAFGDGGLATPGSAVTVTVSLGASLGSHGKTFYGIDMGDAGMNPTALAALGLYYNSTPLTVFRFGDGGGSYDPTTNTFYAPGPTGQYVKSTGQSPNFVWFQSWCYSHTPHCQWLVDLPGEENNSAAALHFAKWYHNVLGFAPTYWEFGNEPISWTHYGINMSKWNSADASTPSGTAYATMVKNYIAAVSGAFPKDKFLGIQSYCACDKVYVPPTAQIDGSKLAGMAFHEYPSIAPTPTLSQFYASLLSPSNVTGAVSHFQSLVTSSCSKCANLPVVIGEYQAGPAGAISSYSTQYPGAPFIAASIIQALSVNVSTFSLFQNSWLINANNGTLNPEGILYQRILSNLTMGTTYAVKLKAGIAGGVFALLVKNGTRQAFLLVNTNTTYSAKLTLLSTFFPIGTSGETWQWGPSQSTPVWHRTTLLGASYAIPAQGILLVTNY